MTGALEPYPAYKDSGVPWFGKVPSHWKVQRLGAILQERGELNQEGQVTQVLSVLRDRGVIPYEQKGNIGNKRSDDISRYKIVQPDDIVMNSMNVIIGSVGRSQYAGCLSPVYYVLKTRQPEDSPNYYDCVFKHKTFQRSLVRLGNGILAHRMRIPMEKLKCELLPVPPPDEQRAIARFLEAIDRLTRRYISAQRRLIALLTEQKQALIQQAVTRGLNPDAPLKDSGIEWLGEIPAHWETIHLKHVATVQTGLTLGKDYGSLSLEERPYLRVANVQDGFLDLSFITTIRVPQSEIVRCELQTGDILMTEGGDRDKLGRGYIWHGEISGCLHQNHIFAVRVNADRLLPEYLILLMTSPYGRRYFELTAKQTTNLASTNTTKLKAFPLLLPSVEEQKRIAEYVAQQSSGLVSAITRTQRQIDLVREYRTRLIADVVTGKLDVRGVALPVEVGRTSESASHLDLEDETDFEKDVEETGSDEEALDE